MRLGMLCLVLGLVLGPNLSNAQSKSARGYVVQFAHSSSANVIAQRASEIEKAGIREARVVESPLRGGRRVYRLVSRSFESYGAARLAAGEVRRLLRGRRIPFEGLILREPVGRPLIR